MKTTKWGLKNLKRTPTIEEIRSQIQEDLMVYLYGMNDRIINEVCQIVVDNFNTLNISEHETTPVITDECWKCGKVIRYTDEFSFCPLCLQQQ